MRGEGTGREKGGRGKREGRGQCEGRRGRRRAVRASRAGGGGSGAALREGRAGQKELEPRALGQVGGGRDCRARAGRAGAEHGRRAGESRESIHPLWAGGKRRAGEPIPEPCGGRRAAAPVGQAIHGSWRNPSRPLSLRLINTVIELLIHCSVAAQGPTIPGRNSGPVSCGSLTVTSDSRFLQDSAFPSLGSGWLSQSSSPLHFTAWHLDGNRS